MKRSKAVLMVLRRPYTHGYTKYSFFRVSEDHHQRSLLRRWKRSSHSSLVIPHLQRHQSFAPSFPPSVILEPHAMPTYGWCAPIQKERLPLSCPRIRVVSSPLLYIGSYNTWQLLFSMVTLFIFDGFCGTVVFAVTWPPIVWCH